MARFNNKNWKRPKIEHKKFTAYGWLVLYPENLKLGKYTDIGAFTLINAKHGVFIGNQVEIGPHCSLITNNTIEKTKGPIILKKNCRIGSHSTIMPNVTIGENSLIGAYSFINKNIPKNTLAYGIPVKIIRKLTKKGA